MRKRTRIISLLACGALVLGAWQGIGIADDEGSTEAKHSIEDVMKVAMKGGLLKKVTGGDATAEEKAELLDMFISLVENKPHKGDMSSWHNLAGGAALAAAKVVVGRDGAIDELKKATNCKACHELHKGE